MDRELIAGELVKMAKELVGIWTPVRKDVDVTQRNVDLLRSLTTFAPGLGKEVRKRMAASLQDDGYDVRPDGLTREWSKYLTFLAPEDNHNKYHYYAVYSFTDPSAGGTLYVGANCSGRIGIVERAYDLTKKFMGGPARTLASAVSACEKHMREKLAKGYEVQKMVRG